MDKQQEKKCQVGRALMFMLMPEVEDDRVWDMLILLSGIDLKNSPKAYLHSTYDLNDWIKQYTEEFVFLLVARRY